MSKLEDELAVQFKAYKITGWEREYRFHPTRKWRFDFAFLDRKLYVEIDGGIWVRGRHGTGMGISGDAEKTNEATILGWKQLRFTGAHVKSGQAIEWVRKALQ